MNWMNQRIPAIKKMMFEFLKERYSKNDQIIERLAGVLQTDRDTQEFIKLMIDVYEAGYMKSVEDHRDQLTKAGIQVKVTSGH